MTTRNGNEYVCLKVKGGALSLTVVLSCIQPTARFDSHELTNIGAFTPTCCMVRGDFNAHHELWVGVRSSGRGGPLFQVAIQLHLYNVSDGTSSFM